MKKQLHKKSLSHLGSAFCLLGLFSIHSATAQIRFEGVNQFDQQPAPPELKWMNNGTKDLVDLDGDGDLDYFLTGFAISSSREAWLYTNDGSGNFTLDTSSVFDGVRYSAVAFDDIDGDGDKDIVLTGEKSNSENIAKLYRNDGTGKFSEIPDAGLVGVENSSVDFADVDGDEDKDLLLSGRDIEGNFVTKLYLNDGTGAFTESLENTFPQVQGQVIFADFDNDLDMDCLLAGYDGTDQLLKFFENDGTGKFSEVVHPNVVTPTGPRVALTHLNNDAFIDLVALGTSGESSVYLNDGAGVFQTAIDFPLSSVTRGSFRVGDVDGDTDMDLVVYDDIGGKEKTRAFLNDGSGNFADGVDVGLAGWDQFVLGHIDDDDDLDVILGPTFYLNDGAGSFEEWKDSPFMGMYGASSAMADVDGDSDLDIMVMGKGPYGNVSTALYLNDGSGHYEGKPDHGVESLYGGTLDFADVDGDKDQDVYVTGRKSSGGYYAEVYLNDGAGNFTLKAGNSFIRAMYSSVDFADVDGDEDLDLFVAGVVSGTPTSGLYINDGTGLFSKSSQAFDGVAYGSISFADLNGDEFQDIMVVGQNTPSKKIFKAYENDGQGNFSAMSGLSVKAGRSSVAVAGDTDGDGDLDLIVTEGSGRTSYYRNQGEGEFVVDQQITNNSNVDASMHLVDVDHDGDLDLFVSSTTPAIYENDGEGNFSLVEGLDLPAVSEGDSQVGDIDGDGDLDLLIVGENANAQGIVKLFRNESVNTGIKLDNGTLTAVGMDASYQWVDCMNGNAPIAGATEMTFIPEKDGVFALEITYNGNVGVSDCMAMLNTEVELVDDNLVSQAEGVNYQWLDCSNNEPVLGADTKEWNPEESGMFAVEVSLGAYKDTSDCFSYAKPLGVEDENGMGITLSPNPTSGQLHVEFGQVHEQVRLTVRSVTGQEMYSVDFAQGDAIDHELQVEKGVYFLTFSTPNQLLKTMKVVKE